VVAPGLCVAGCAEAEVEPAVIEDFISSSSQLKCDAAEQVRAIGDERSTMWNLWSLFLSSFWRVLSGMEPDRADLAQRAWGVILFNVISVWPGLGLGFCACLSPA
jgi:hypothetical protein